MLLFSVWLERFSLMSEEFHVPHWSSSWLLWPALKLTCRVKHYILRWVSHFFGNSHAAETSVGFPLTISANLKYQILRCWLPVFTPNKGGWMLITRQDFCAYLCKGWRKVLGTLPHANYQKSGPLCLLFPLPVFSTLFLKQRVGRIEQVLPHNLKTH